MENVFTFNITYLRILISLFATSYPGSLPRTQALSRVPTSYPGSSLVLRISSSYSGSLPRTQAPSYPGSLLEVILALTVYRMYTRCSNNIISTRIFLFQHAQISEEDAEDFENDVLLPLRLSKAAPFVLLGLGAILLFIAGIISYRRHQRKVSRSWLQRSQELQQFHVTRDNNSCF